MFSELVDRVTSSLMTGNSDARKAEVTQYVNSVRRKIHMRGSYVRDRAEQSVECSGASTTFTWPVPRNVRNIVTAKYKFGRDGYGAYPVLTTPSVKFDTQPYSVYRFGEYYTFNGIFDGEVILLLLQLKSMPLRYYAENSRPAVYDRDTETWTYLDIAGNYVATLGSEELDAAARAKVYDWVLDDYEDLVFYGAMNLAQKVQDNQRASNYYALYRDALTDMHQAEGGDTLGTTTMVGGAANV